MKDVDGPIELDVGGVSEHDGLGADESEPMSDEELLDGAPPHVRATLLRWFAEADEQRRSLTRASRLRELAAPRARRRTGPLQPGEERGTSTTLAVRLPRWVEEQIRRRFEMLGVSPSTGLRQILEEWCVEQMFPALEHRDPGFLRFAAVRDGPDIIGWLDAGKPELDNDVHEQALDYVELFRGRLEAARFATR